MLKILLANKYAQSVLIYAFVSAMLAFLPLFLLPIITKFVSVDLYGDYVIYVIIVKLITAIISLGYLESTAREFSIRTPEDFSKFYTGTLIRVICSGFVLALFLNLTYFSFSELFNVDIVFLNWLVPVALSHFIVNTLLSMFQMSSNPAQYAKYRIIQVVFEYLFLFLVVYFFNPTNNLIYSSFIFASFLTMGFALCWMIKSKVIVRIERFRFVDASLKTSLPIIPHQLSGMFLSFSDRIIIKSTLGAASVGVYSIGYQFGQIVSLVDTAINKAWLPWLYKQLQRDNVDYKKIKLLCVAYVIILFLFSLLNGYVGHFLIDELYPFEYNAAKDVVLIISLSFFVFGVYKLLASFLFFWKKTVFLGVVTPIVLLVNVLSAFLLIPSFGLIGAAYSTLGSFAFYVCVVFVYLISLSR